MQGKQERSDIPRELQDLQRHEALLSEWMVIEQKDTDAFAKLTNDEDPMHNDPEWASKTHWGGTIVQATHVLALGAGQASQLPVETKSDGSHFVLNYGYDRVRVISPLRVGHPFRYRTKIEDVRQKSDDAYVIKLEVTIEVQGRSDPFMVYESLVYWATNQNMEPPTSE